MRDKVKGFQKVQHFRLPRDGKPEFSELFQMHRRLFFSLSYSFTEAQHHVHTSPSMETPILSGHVLSALEREPDFIRTADRNIFAARDSLPWDPTNRAAMPETFQSFSSGRQSVRETLDGLR